MKWSDIDLDVEDYFQKTKGDNTLKVNLQINLSRWILAKSCANYLRQLGTKYILAKIVFNCPRVYFKKS